MKGARFVIVIQAVLLLKTVLVGAFSSVQLRHKPTKPRNDFATAATSWCRSSSRSCKKWALQAHCLTSALESLGLLSEDDWIQDLSVLGSAGQHQASPDADNKDSIVFPFIPLYPLPTVYVPSGNSITYTLQNIEPRNVQMAMDVMDGRQFCAVLRAADTGRLAKVGTLMRIIDMEVKAMDGDVQKIVLTCVAQDAVDILSIDNPEAVDFAYRLKHPKEYLRATVQTRRATETNIDWSDEDDSRVLALASQIAKDFNRVREYLMEGFGTDDLPPFARTNLADALPPLEASQLASPSTFWQAVYQWQTYAYTLREGYQQNMATDRNELLIAGALKKGGPLNLPVHLTDLLPEDRQQVVQLEQNCQQAWVDTGLEPVLDFQALLVAEHHVERLEKMSTMVSRERERLTMIALLPRAPKEENEPEEQIVPKGAWFDADL